MKPLGVLSLLHEPPADNSATRAFRNQLVLWWTLARLAAVPGVERWTILCWSDQAADVQSCAGLAPVRVHSIGPRKPIPHLDALTAASRWLDGWRGGLLQTCDFDRGFHAPSLLQLLSDSTQLGTGNWELGTPSSNPQSHDSVLLVDPASALVDPDLVSSLLAHAAANPDEYLVFSPAAPGLSATLVRLPLLKQLAQANLHPGKLLSYLQDQPGKDPIARPCCAPVPTPVARTTRRFKLDSARQVQRLSREFESLNGQLARTGAEQLVRLADADPTPDPLPRELTIELTTLRNTSPLWSPLRYAKASRPDFTRALASELFAQLADYPDTRITFAGLGDPLLHDDFPTLIQLAHAHGLRSLHLETDLLGLPADRLATLATLPLDIVSVHLPAVTQETYAKMMGVDAYLQVLENVKSLVATRHAAGRGVPILVPTFVKCRDNLHEMEAWYDQWLRVLGSAVITAPTAHNNVVPAEAIGISHMAPPKRRPCARLWNRLTILSDGAATRCEEDLVVPNSVGNLANMTIKELWAALNPLRQAHAAGKWDACGPCTACQEWHRP